MELFRLFGSVLIDNKEAIDALNKTDKKASDLNSGLGKLVSGSAAVGKAVVGMGAVAVGGLTAMVVKMTETTSLIKDNAEKAGMSAEEYQKWKFAAEQSGMSIETLQGAMVRQQKSFSEAKTGNKALADTYKQLGVDLSSINNSEDAFNQTMAALAGISNEAQRNALANDLFGKSYAQLTPLLNEGVTGMDALKQKAVELGGVMSNEAVAKGEAFGDTLDQLKTASGGIVNSIGTALVPIIQKFADSVIANMPKVESAFKLVSDGIQWLIDNSNWLVPVIAGVVAAFTGMQIVGVINTLMAAYTAFTKGATITQAILNAVMAANPIMLVVLAIAALIAIGVALIMNWDKVKAWFVGFWEMLKTGFATMVETISAPFQSAYELISNIMKSLMEVVKVPLNWMIDKVNSFISGINKIKIPNWVPGVGGKSINLPKIPRLKVGIDYVPSDYFPAFLDKGERVLTAAENAKYSGSGTSGGITIGMLQEAMSGMTFSIDGRPFGRLVKSYV